MGLLDYLSAPDAGNGIGGLLSYLQSPLYQSPPAAPAPQPQYDAMGNYTGITPDAPNPFGPIPQMSMPAPGQFQPPSAFNGGAPASPIAGLAGGTPAPALPPAQTIAPAPQVADATRTMNIGGYQMPQIGAAADYTPQPSQMAQAAPTDVSAQSRAQPGPLPAFLQTPGQGGFGGAFRGMAANAQAGPLGMLMGAIGGAAGMGRGNPQDIAQQNLTAQYHSLRQALEANGDSKQQAASKAMLAVMNPDAAKTIIPELFTNKEKYGVISEDPLQGKQYGFINEREQTVNGKPINAQAAPANNGSMAAVQQAQQAGVTGEALYEHLPAQMRGTVKAMIEGRQPLPSTAAMRSPATLALIDAAHAIDPTFDATSWGARAAGAKDFTSGKSSEMVRAANQTLAHVGSLLDAMDNLKNTRFPIANAIGNTVREQFGAGEQGAFRTNAHAVAEEMSKVFKGANLSDSEIRHWEQNLSESMSPEQQKAQIAKLSELLHGSLAALEEKRAAAIGPMAAAKAGPVIKEEGQKVLERIDNWVKSNGAQTAQPAAKLPSGWSVQVR